MDKTERKTVRSTTGCLSDKKEHLWAVGGSHIMFPFVLLKPHLHFRGVNRVFHPAATGGARGAFFSNKLTQPILSCYSCTCFVCNENTGRLISAADTLSLSCRGHRQCLPVLPIKKTAVSLAAVSGVEYQSWEVGGFKQHYIILPCPL